MSAVLLSSIALLLVTGAGALVVLVRSGETRAGLLAGLAAAMAVRQTTVAWQRWGESLGFDLATAGELLGLAASGLALLALLAVRNTLAERDRVEALHWNAMEGVRALGELARQRREPLEARVARLLEIGCQCFDLPIGIASRISDPRYEVWAIRAPDGFPVARGDVLDAAGTACRSALAATRALAVARVADSSLSVRPPLAFGSYLGTALHVDGEARGTLCFAAPEPRAQPFTATEKDLLTLMARWLDGEIERARASADGRPTAAPERKRAQPEAPALAAPVRAARRPRARAAVRERDAAPPRSVDVNAALRRLQRKLRRRLGAEIELRLALDPALRRADARRLPLQAVVTSLVENAARAMPEGGCIRLATANLATAPGEPGVAASSGYVTLSVSDTAARDGDALASVFARPGNGDAAGAGGPLPIPVVRRILERAGGDLSVEVDPGNGTTFTVYLPLPDGEASPRARGNGGLASRRTPAPPSA